MIIQMGKEEIRRRAFDDLVPAWTRRGKKRRSVRGFQYNVTSAGGRKMDLHITRLIL